MSFPSIEINCYAFSVRKKAGEKDVIAYVIPKTGGSYWGGMTVETEDSRLVKKPPAYGMTMADELDLT
jgi:hypothetical protein